MPFPLQQIQEPVLLLNNKQCEKNIRAMADRARHLKLRFRPHFKTHQATQIGTWFRDVGTKAITVSSLPMAEYFAASGWKDICLAFPVNIRQFNRLIALAQKVKLILLVDQLETAQLLAQTTALKVSVRIKLAVGNNRAGIAVRNQQGIANLLQTLKDNDHLKVLGFLAHAGQSYQARGYDEVLKVHTQYLEHLRILTTKYPHLSISVGDTPTCSLMNEFPGVSEIRPGVFVFYDLMQEQIGACQFEQIAVAMACPIIAIYEDRDAMLIHGGAIHFSKEALLDKQGNKFYGKVVQLHEEGWSEPLGDVRFSSISQEHGLIHGSNLKQRFKVGDLIGVIPVHACLTANLMKGYQPMDGAFITQMPTLPSSLTSA